jgi:hypothetical protein
MTISKDKVREALRAEKGSTKTKGWLAKTVDSKLCFCIEGVFCEVATKLGYKGKFEKQRGGSAFNFTPTDSILKNTYQYKVLQLAPREVFDFLGIPTHVPNKCLSDRTLAEVEALSGFDATGRSLWHIINDSSSLSLDQLIELAIKVLDTPTAAPVHLLTGYHSWDDVTETWNITTGYPKAEPVHTFM